jgi:DNA-binding response OmpR family regulator
MVRVVPSVLLIGNDPLLQQRMQHGLEAHGCVIETAGTGRAALKQASQHRPDVVVLEMWLPDLDGIALAVALRAACGERLPILILGASLRDLARAQPQGTFTYLRTPLQLDELLASVDEALKP